VSGVIALRMLPGNRRRSPHSRRSTYLLVLAVLGCGLLGCSVPDPGVPPASVTATPLPEVAVLRGTPIGPAAAEQPALAVKIDNNQAARPQLGLDRADLVFEQLVEGGLTRYAALWHSDVPHEVGPVRSIRPMDPDILGSFGGIVAYSGGQPQFIEAMRDTALLNVVFDDAGTGVFRRADDRSAPHDVLLSAVELVRLHADLAAPGRQFDYAGSAAASGAASSGDPVGSILVGFSPSSGRGWTWDPGVEAYLRSQDGAPDLDAAGVQLQASNVLVLRVDVDRSGEVPRTLLSGSGAASVSSNGSSMPATWFKDAPIAPIRLADAAGATIDLAPGNTWIELVPSDDGSVELVP
jgi:hypothetical protein